MVKVGSMRRKRILLIASLLLLTAGASSASWRRKGDRPAEAAAPAAMTLTAIETESAPTARLILRTSGTPAYTSYSPTPDTFVIDLSGASKAPSLTIPSLLPPSITSVTAEEVTEMGTRVMRVTVHLAQPAALQASADDHAVAVMLPAKEEALPAVTTVVEAVKPVEEPVVKTEPLGSATVPAAVGDASRVPGGETPPVRPAETPALRAKTLKSVTTSGSGPTLSVQLAADGDVVYNAFSLEKPSRLVIDLNDVTDKVAKGAIDVNGAVVKKVRVAQFKGGAEPVTRVVVDLAAKSPYKVTKDGDRLVVTFGGSEGQTPAPVQVAEEIKKPEPKPVEPKPVEMKPVETKPVEMKPVECMSGLLERLPVGGEKPGRGRQTPQNRNRDQWHEAAQHR